MKNRVRRKRPSKPAVGHLRKIAPRSEARLTSVTFPGDMFAYLKRRAKREKTSFSEQVRLLVEWGSEQDGGY